MEITGTVHKINEVQVFKNDFKKQEIVVKTMRNSSDNYPQYIPIEFVKDNIDHLHGIVAGDNVTVSINVKGREYNDKYYVSLEGWKLKKDKQEIFATNDILDNPSSHGDCDDLPFN